MKTALIIGVTGQDGSLLARLLIDKGYHVVGTSRDAQLATFANLRRLGILDQVRCVSAITTDFRSILTVLSEVRPEEIYALAGQSSVGLSFEQPVETLESIATGTLNLLEAVRFLDLPTRIYNAGSSECFGDLEYPADELQPFRPRSPYAAAKASAHWLVANYREAYGLYACTGILFNHESPLRPERFVTRKIISAACRIAAGSEERLRLGNMSIERDWGWAPEYVHAMWLMLQQDDPQDVVIATGQSHSLQRFVEMAFSQLDLDWLTHVDQDPQLHRPTDIAHSVGNPALAAKRLGWRAGHDLEQTIAEMIRAERGERWSELGTSLNDER